MSDGKLETFRVSVPGSDETFTKGLKKAAKIHDYEHRKRVLGLIGILWDRSCRPPAQRCLRKLQSSSLDDSRRVTTAMAHSSRRVGASRWPRFRATSLRATPSSTQPPHSGELLVPQYIWHLYRHQPSLHAVVSSLSHSTSGIYIVISLASMQRWVACPDLSLYIWLLWLLWL